jgi:dihydroorotate dehydrogenase
MYKFLFWAVLRPIPAETAHRLGFGLIRFAVTIPGIGSLLRCWLAPKDSILRVRALGHEFPGPLGLAAGFDKDARGPDALGALGFGFVEVGTLTAQAQPGNPKPRLFRLPANRALINRMGFNNQGAVAAATRLRARRGNELVVGVNIGKTKAVPESDTAADYIESAKTLAAVADYLVINVSSPNTPGLRNLQAVDTLRPLILSVRGALESMNMQRPHLLIKIAPDLPDEEIDAIADVALELGLEGIIATNTPASLDYLTGDLGSMTTAETGGLSGAPLRHRALEVLQRLHDRVGSKLTLVAVGGIQTVDDAWERITAGATLLQGYTGFVYGGPLWPHRIHTGLALRAHEAGFTSIQEAVGTAKLPSQSIERPPGS